MLDTIAVTRELLADNGTIWQTNGIEETPPTCIDDGGATCEAQETDGEVSSTVCGKGTGLMACSGLFDSFMADSLSSENAVFSNMFLQDKFCFSSVLSSECDFVLSFWFASPMFSSYFLTWSVLAGQVMLLQS